MKLNVTKSALTDMRQSYTFVAKDDDAVTVLAVIHARRAWPSSLPK